MFQAILGRRSHISIALTLLILLTASTAEAEQWTVSDFPSHVTDLTQEHKIQLSEITSYLADLSNYSGEIICLLYIGHAAKWKNISDSEYNFRALNRAQNAAAYIGSALEMRGLTSDILEEENLDEELGCESGESDFRFYFGGRGEDEPLVPNLVSRVDAEARKNRSLNRRVDIESVRYISPQGQCVPEPRVVRALSKMKPAGSDADRSVRVLRIRNMLMKHYGCTLTLDDYYHIPEIGGAHLLKTFEKRCKGKKRHFLANCLNDRHDDILFMINYVEGEIFSLSDVLGVTPASIRKTEECDVGRYYLRKAALERSVYNAFRPLIERGFSLCASS